MSGIERLLVRGKVAEVEGFYLLRENNGSGVSTVEVYTKDTLEKIGTVECDTVDDIFYQNNVNHKYGIVLLTCINYVDPGKRDWAETHSMFWKYEDLLEFSDSSSYIGRYIYIRDEEMRTNLVVPYYVDGSDEGQGQVVLQLEDFGGGQINICIFVIKNGKISGELSSTHELEVDDGIVYEWVTNDSGIYLLAKGTLRLGNNIADETYWAYKVLTKKHYSRKGFKIDSSSEGYELLESPKIVTKVKELEEVVKSEGKVDESWYTKVKFEG